MVSPIQIQSGAAAAPLLPRRENRLCTKVNVCLGVLALIGATAFAGGVSSLKGRVTIGNSDGPLPWLLMIFGIILMECSCLELCTTRRDDNDNEELPAQPPTAIEEESLSSGTAASFV